LLGGELAILPHLSLDALLARFGCGSRGFVGDFGGNASNGRAYPRKRAIDLVELENDECEQHCNCDR
jgi:hypothetical protein